MFGLTTGRLLVDKTTQKVYSPEKGLFISTPQSAEFCVFASPLSMEQANDLIRTGDLADPLNFMSKDEREEFEAKEKEGA